MRAFTVAALIAGCAVAVAQPDDLIVVQGESFACVTDAWVAREQSSRYAPDSALRHLHGASGGQGVATTQIEVPAAGRYAVWVRHTVGRGDLRGPFRLRIMRGDETLAEGRFDERPPQVEPEQIHRYDWSRFEADLPAGTLTLALEKVEPITCSGYTRQVDCVALTTDTEYEPDVVHWQPKVWLRVTLGPTETPPIYIHCFADHFRAPYYKHFSLSKDGYEVRVAPGGGRSTFLQAGEATPWCDITDAIHEDRGARLELRGAEKYSYDEWLPSLDATFDFATAPSDDAIVKSFHREGPGAGLVVMVPGVLSEQTADQLRRDTSFRDESVALATTVPVPEFGRRPERFPVILTMRMRPHLFEPGIREDEYAIAARMGFTGTRDHPDELLQSLGFRNFVGHPSAWYMQDRCYLQPQRERIAERVAKMGAEWDEPPTLVMITDEPAPRPLEHAVSCAVCTERFRAWLREQGVTLAELGAASWDDVRPAVPGERDSRPAAYYWSQRFRVKAFADFLRLQTEEAAGAFPGNPPATVNFSDGAVFSANMYRGGNDYFEIFRSGALTMAWSEDWSNIASTYECCGWNVELLRAAAREREQPLGMYVITSYGRTPLDVKLKAYSSLGRGVDVLQSFSYGPSYCGHEPGWYLNAPMYRAWSELTREIGAAEDLLIDAERAPSEVAILYSTTSDVWTANECDLHGHDRMHSYLALTHAQVPVDVLHEDDVIAGALQGRRVLYLFGPNLPAELAAPIAEWVRGGGTLYLGAGAAVADRYNQPARPLDEALGIVRGEPEMLQNHTGPGRYLTNLEPQGTVAADGAEMTVLGLRQPIAMRASDDVALSCEAQDGVPLSARVRCGEGTVFVAGFMPGLGYIHEALVKRDAEGSPAPDPNDWLDFATRGSWSNLPPGALSYNPWEYPPAEREFLLRPVRAAGVEPPVTLSEPLIEAFLLESERGAVVTLANYSLQPVDALTVTVRLDREPASVESARLGPLEPTMADGKLTVTLPLTDTDIVLMRW